jgi:hypothetical protein
MSGVNSHEGSLLNSATHTVQAAPLT